MFRTDGGGKDMKDRGGGDGVGRGPIEGKRERKGHLTCLQCHLPYTRGREPEGMGTRILIVY